MATEPDGFINVDFDDDEAEEAAAGASAHDDDEDDVELHGASSYH